MLKKVTSLTLLAGGLLVAAAKPASAQAGPAATALSNVQIGAGFTYARTDYGFKGDKGLTLFGDYDIGVHWGAEAAWHYTSLITPENVSENSFVAGPRIIFRKDRLKFYGKGLIGIGKLNIPRARVNETDTVFGAGGGLEYLSGQHLTIRAVDVEYQRWNYVNGLTPIVLTTGVAYRFH